VGPAGILPAEFVCQLEHTTPLVAILASLKFVFIRDYDDFG